MPIDTSIDRVAPTRVTVLIDGGSEEERTAVARALHDRSPRRHEPFTTIDCAAAAHHEMDRLLGGTASQRATRVTGLGTLCVSNVDAMPRWLQPRFLGFLDGGGRPRIVVSARVDLAAAAREGRFWPDLSERLFLVRIAIAARP
jgi:DNA-binding NtrC family response regulator